MFLICEKQKLSSQMTYFSTKLYLFVKQLPTQIVCEDVRVIFFLIFLLFQNISKMHPNK
jgi:hypothetical protein